MTGLFDGDDSDEDADDESRKKRCDICQELKEEAELDDDGLCQSCRSASTQTCPRCRSTSITTERKDNPRPGTHAPGSFSIWECENCGFTSGARHDWRWK